MGKRLQRFHIGAYRGRCTVLQESPWGRQEVLPEEVPGRICGVGGSPLTVEFIVFLPKQPLGSPWGHSGD